MIDHVFEFEKEKVPSVVLFATAALIAIFAVGIPYRLLVGF
ncbi:hypothetical protein [Natronobacterium gregoryi]|uniref:Uncharacterized protein n=2 Tax=Natronobacterium gregoryi TaxID=44930 RepID=L0AIK3_NATGS|nr:hypothetical protein [Natronobacterium gregoryi]AFZ73718.1 hypothetical protein Natgr_2563 [Natronobacterium gregoryi SP2]ELY67678.1 hypothetical protein C490_10927 [Natronobacterium gregoryi SP2]SFJ01901.1 hypothetical protein SAMN05443661_11197 [Natronobacterium gregoryi]